MKTEIIRMFSYRPGTTKAQVCDKLQDVTVHVAALNETCLTFKGTKRIVAKVKSSPSSTTEMYSS